MALDTLKDYIPIHVKEDTILMMDFCCSRTKNLTADSRPTVSQQFFPGALHNYRDFKSTYMYILAKT